MRLVLDRIYRIYKIIHSRAVSARMSDARYFCNNLSTNKHIKSVLKTKHILTGFTEFVSIVFHNAARYENNPVNPVNPV